MHLAYKENNHCRLADLPSSQDPNKIHTDIMTQVKAAAIEVVGHHSCRTVSTAEETAIAYGSVLGNHIPSLTYIIEET